MPKLRKLFFQATPLLAAAAASAPLAQRRNAGGRRLRSQQPLQAATASISNGVPTRRLTLLNSFPAGRKPRVVMDGSRRFAGPTK